MQDALLRLPQVQQRVALSRSAIYKLMSKDAFPKQVRISFKVAAWKESEIDAWISAQGESA